MRQNEKSDEDRERKKKRNEWMKCINTCLYDSFTQVVASRYKFCARFQLDFDTYWIVTRHTLSFKVWSKKTHTHMANAQHVKSCEIFIIMTYVYTARVVKNPKNYVYKRHICIFFVFLCFVYLSSSSSSQKMPNFIGLY